MEENLYIRHMPNPGHSSKRLIVCMSDMHLDSRWSRLIDEHLNEFMIKMSSVAEVWLLILVVFEPCGNLINSRNNDNFDAFGGQFNYMVLLGST